MATPTHVVAAAQVIGTTVFAGAAIRPVAGTGKSTVAAAGTDGTARPVGTAEAADGAKGRKATGPRPRAGLATPCRVASMTAAGPAKPAAAAKATASLPTLAAGVGAPATCRTRTAAMRAVARASTVRGTAMRAPRPGTAVAVVATTGVRPMAVR